MDSQDVTSKSGLVRLRLQTPAGRWVNVGPFGTLAGARCYAESLIEDRSVKAARVEHRNKGQWRPAWSWLVGAALLLLLFSGCVSSGKVGPDIWHSLTPAERAEADVLEQAMAKLAARCHEENPKDPCVPPRVYVHGSGTTPSYVAGHIISVPRRALDPRLRPLMAHELSHAWFADARDDCQIEAKAVICERNANFHGIAVLMAGYGYDARTATKMMWALLAVAVRNHTKPLRGHPDACAELHDLERRMDAVTYYKCDELTGAAR